MTKDDRLVDRVVRGPVEPMQPVEHLRRGDERPQRHGKRFQIVGQREMRIEDRVLHQGRCRVELVDGKAPILPTNLPAVRRDQAIGRVGERRHLIDGQRRAEQVMALRPILFAHPR